MVPVSPKELHRVTFTKDLAVTVSRIGISGGCKFLDKNINYVITEKMVDKLREADPDLSAIPLSHRPLTQHSKKLMVYFPGGIGDVICIKPCLEDLLKLRPDLELAVVSTVSDKPLIGDVCTLYDYPLPEGIADSYDAWINIAEMAQPDVGKELAVVFSEHFGITPPTHSPHLVPETGLLTGLKGLIVDNKRPKVAVQMASMAHFRSIPSAMGVFCMMGLAEQGCDCYVMGTEENRLVFTDNSTGSKVSCGPPEHIYDMTIAVGPLEYLIGFISLMDAVLTADTAALHIGGALGIPTLGLFGMTDGSVRTGYYPSATYMQGKIDCSPCAQIWMDPPCDKKNCEAVLSIPILDIIDKVMEMIKRGKDDHKDQSPS